TRLALLVQVTAVRRDRRRLAVHLDGVEDVVRVLPGVRDVVRVHGGEQAGDEDDDEEDEEGERDLVPPETTPREEPRAPADDRRTTVLGGGQLGRGVEGEFALVRLLNHLTPPKRTSGAPYPAPPTANHGRATTCDRSSRSRTDRARAGRSSSDRYPS